MKNKSKNKYLKNNRVLRLVRFSQIVLETNCFRS